MEFFSSSKLRVKTQTKAPSLGKERKRREARGEKERGKCVSALRERNPKRTMTGNVFIAGGGKTPKIKNEAVLCAEPFRDSHSHCLLFEHTEFKAALPSQPDK